MHVGKKSSSLWGSHYLSPGSLRIFWGITWFQEGTRGKGGQASLPGGGTQRKLTANHKVIIRTLQSLMGGGGAEESLIVTHPHDK